jgi:response regulator RpfG family c-di-GMP phosphodiesterase
MVKNETYDLVLMDLQMPNMNGFEATKQIRTKLPLNKRNIPIVAMTAHVVDGIAKKCLEVGMNDCLSKPIKTELLFNKIASVLNLPEKATDLPKDKNGTSNSKKSQVTNLKLIHQISKGDSKKIIKYINIYLDNIPKDLKGFNAAVDKGDYETMSSLAHKIKGNASYPGVESVIKDLTLLEKTNGSSENTNEITNIAKRVTSILEQSLIELNQHILE